VILGKVCGPPIVFWGPHQSEQGGGTRMTETLRIFAQCDGPDSQQVDAAPGLEPPKPPKPPEVDYGSLRLWKIEWVGAFSGSRWCTDLQIAKEWIRRKNLKEEDDVIIKRVDFDPKERITCEHFKQGPTEPRHFHVACLDVHYRWIQTLGRNGYWTLGKVADMSAADWKRIGFTPDSCRAVEGCLAEYGLSLSFKLLHREHKCWSKTRLSARQSA